MIVQCPACSSRYRIADEKIPAKGGNLKCPSCGHAFFVKRPEAEAPNAASAGPAASSSSPSPTPEKEPGALDEVAKALLSQLDDDDWLGGGTGTTPAIEREPAPSPAAPEPAPSPAAPVSGRRSIQSGSTESLSPKPGLSEDALNRLDATLDSDLDDELAAVLAAASGAAEEDSDDAADEDASGADAPAPTREQWKVKSAAGLVFDFPDRAALRKWLGARDSHEGILITRDGGTTWTGVTDTDGVDDVKPSMLRASAASRRTGDNPALTSGSQPTVRRAAVTGSQRAAGGKDTNGRKELQIATSESRAAKRSVMWFIVLLLVLGGVFGLHVAGIVDIPGLRSSAPAPTVQPVDIAPRPEPTPPQVEETIPEDDSGTRTERVGTQELYAATLSRARRLVREGDVDGGLRTLDEAIAFMPNNPEAYCLAAEIARDAELPLEDIDARQQRCNAALEAAAARASQGENGEDDDGNGAEDP